MLYATAPIALFIVEAIADETFVYGLDRASTIASASLGFLIGLVGLVALFGLQIALGWLRVKPMPVGGQSMAKTILLTGSLAVGVSLVEEVIFRSFLLTQFSKTAPFYLSAGLSSLIFALLHLVWDWQNTRFQLAGLWTMGMVLAWAYRLDGFSLGLPWGLHAGWILGIALVELQGKLLPTGQVAVWITGAAEQPLAGLSTLSFLGGTAGLLWLVLS
ncbi:MAG: CPBP family intramembrane glutamic endopeptidase [Elainellaceae cyanobacterium]